MQEAEQSIVPLEEVFNRVSVQNLRSQGVKGAILIELPIDELISMAQSKGYEADHYDANRHNLETGVAWIRPKDASYGVELYTKPGDQGGSVYVLDDEFETFKELFLEGAVG